MKPSNEKYKRRRFGRGKNIEGHGLDVIGKIKNALWGLGENEGSDPHPHFGAK